nr:unnamed protein product [Digitaria exilis]
MQPRRCRRRRSGLGRGGPRGKALEASRSFGGRRRGEPGEEASGENFGSGEADEGKARESGVEGSPAAPLDFSVLLLAL